MLPPLAGFTIGITADRRADEQAELLRRRGAEIVHGPTIRTRPLADSPELATATEQLVARPPDTLVALTGLGVRSWFEAADSRGRGDELRDSLAGAQILARGPKAAGALATVGLEAHWWAAGESSDEVVAHLGFDLGGRRIAVQRDGGERPFTAEALAARGADVVDVPVYRWELPDDPRPAQTLVAAVLDEAVDAVTFTSAPAVSNLFGLAGDDAGRLAAALSGPVLAVCVGPVCADRLAEHGVRAAVYPARWRLGPMIRVLSEALGGRGQHLRLGQHHALVQGATVVVDGVEVRLPRREQLLLTALVDAGGGVIAKSELARRVWDPTTDPHVVEVTVARLRARLGAAAGLIETVPRRGYRVAVASS